MNRDIGEVERGSLVEEGNNREALLLLVGPHPQQASSEPVRGSPQTHVRKVENRQTSWFLMNREHWAQWSGSVGEGDQSYICGRVGPGRKYRRHAVSSAPFRTLLVTCSECNGAFLDGAVFAQSNVPADLAGAGDGGFGCLELCAVLAGVFQ